MSRGSQQDNGATYTVDFTVGRLLCGSFRHGLQALKFKGYRIDWLEGPGWIERTFTVKCEPTAYTAIREATSGWNGLPSKPDTK